MSNRFEILNRLTVEYVVIVEVLKKRYSDKIIETKSQIYLERELFEQLLGEKKFLDLAEKKSIWRSLKWIAVDKDGGRYTKNISSKGKSFRRIVIEKGPYLELKRLTLDEK